MHVLVTGGTGFVGRALVARLLGDRHRVTAWVRSPERARTLLGEEAGLASGGPEALAVAMSGVDGVVNLAGENVMGGRWTAARRAVLVGSRVGVT